jgi:2-keto-3-deoxy-L-rhamnonate aldolase RhmA
MKPDMLNQLREARLHPGSWISSGSPVITELAAECGFDWLLIDMEHGLGSEEGLLAQLMAFKGTSTAAIVRVGAPHPDLILRALDRGADGIMIPHVSTAEEADACVRAVHYPPCGRRGYSRSVRACHYGLQPPQTEIAPLVIAQIETVEGVENAAAIAAVDGIDVLFAGPADLNFDLKNRQKTSGLSYFQCLEITAAAAAKHGKQSGILLRDIADLEEVRTLGFTWVALDSDLAILRRSYLQMTGKNME